jgi:hypothetical protein
MRKRAPLRCNMPAIALYWCKPSEAKIIAGQYLNGNKAVRGKAVAICQLAWRMLC